MHRDTDRTPSANDKANRIVAGVVGGLAALTVVVVLIVSLGSRGGIASGPGPSPEATVSAIATSQPEPAVETAVAVATATVPATTAPTPSSLASPVASKTLPEQMASLPAGSRQIIVITGATLGSNAGVLEVYDLDGGRWVRVLRTGADFGKAGLVDGATRTSGHLQTPTGIWSIGGFVFGQHPTPPGGTKMPYRAITSRSWWSSERDATYNTWVESEKRIDGEHLADSRVQYEYAFDTGYNSPPNERVIGRGAAIFIHCLEPAGNPLGRYTHGCVAIDRARMIELLGILDPARQPVCAIGTLRRGTATSIYSY